MAFAQRATNYSEPIPIDRRAADNLRFIRDTMERASSFTAVPGWGGVTMGVTALATGLVALRMPMQQQFWAWLVEAAVALTIGCLAVRLKSKRLALSLNSRPARRALLSFVPPLLVGADLHSRAVPGADADNPAGIVAVAVWCGGDDWRRIFGAYCAGDGNLFYVARLHCFACAAGSGKCFFDVRFRRNSYRIWNVNCEETRWVDQPLRERWMRPRRRRAG